MGDQLTVERTRSVIKSCVNATSSIDALEGLQPAICDWHAECVLLQVCNFIRCFAMGVNYRSVLYYVDCVCVCLCVYHVYFYVCM